MLLKINKPLGAVCPDDEYLGRFCPPLNRNLYFGLNSIERQGIFKYPGTTHIGFLIPIENNLYEFKVDEITKSSIMSFDDSNKPNKRLMLRALENDYGLMDGVDYELVG